MLMGSLALNLMLAQIMLMPCTCLGANEPISHHFSLSLDLNGSPLLKDIFILQSLISGCCYLNASRLTRGFHARGNIDRISPQVIDKFLRANYSSDDNACINANADLNVLTLLSLETLNFYLHRQCHLGDRFGMICSRYRQPGSYHVSIANGLDFF